MKREQERHDAGEAVPPAEGGSNGTNGEQRADELEPAIRWLKDRLRDGGAVLTSTLFAEARAADIPAKRLRSAKFHLPIAEEREDTIKGRRPRVLWRLEAAVPFTLPPPEPKPTPPPKPTPEINSELAQAQELVAQHGDDLRYVWAWSRWLVWAGPRWTDKQPDEVRRRAQAAARARTVRALDGDAEALRLARAGESNRAIEATLKLAAAAREVAIDHSAFDADRFLLNVRNGTINLRTGELRPHRRADLITKLAPVDYDPSARSELWDKFLAQILPDVDLRAFVQRFMGYAATGDISEQVLALFIGDGANGKTTLLGVVEDLLGPDYVCQVPEGLLIAKKQETHPAERAELHGRRLAIASEIDAGARLNEASLKQLTGGETIKARRLYENFWVFAPTHKFVFGLNFYPRVRAGGHALWRRILVVPFDVVVPKAQQDPDLRAKLLAEAPAILRWLVEGARQWFERRLDPPPSVRGATERYAADQDQVARFLADACIVEPSASVPKKELYDHYCSWAKREGEHRASKRGLGQELLRRGFRDQAIGMRHVETWLGIGLAQLELDVEERP